VNQIEAIELYSWKLGVRNCQRNQLTNKIEVIELYSWKIGVGNQLRKGGQVRRGEKYIFKKKERGENDINSL